jgi:parallel beta-helix repeat protein
MKTNRIPGALGVLIGLMMTVFVGSVWAGQAVLSWSPNTEPDLGGYKVHYGTASGVYTTIVDVGLTGTPSAPQHTVTGLTDGVTYYFAVKAYDLSGNESGFSNQVSKTVSGTDTTPPVISAISSGSITSSGATITWTTNEPADTQVQYGTTSSYGSSTPLNTSLITSHSAGLSGLSPSTTYHFRVLSRDAAGNLAQSADNTFVTTSAPDTTAPTISGVTAGSITSSGATIAWTTNEPADTQVQYGTTASYGSSTSLNTSMVTSHSQSLTGLSSSTLYNFRVLSRDAAGNLATSANFTFTTATAPDTTAPTISGVTAGSITSSGATITWTTNEAATTQVEYGATTAYGSFSTLDSGLVTQHSATLGNLASSTTYHFRVISLDAGGNKTMSPDNSFTTLTAFDTTSPVISDITVTGITDRSATISWGTDEPSTTQVEYGTTTAYGNSTTLNVTLLNSHRQTLTGLSASTVYHFRVMSADTAGNGSVSEDRVFTTARTPDVTPPKDLRDFRGEPGNRRIRLVWTNPDDTDFVGVRIRFRTDGTYPTDAEDGTLVGDFTGEPNGAGEYLHSNLTNGITHLYAAFTYDAEGNFSHTVYASATPTEETSTSETQEIEGGFGCGMVDITAGPRGRAGGSADLLLLCAMLLWFGMRRTMRDRLAPYLAGIGLLFIQSAAPAQAQSGLDCGSVTVRCVDDTAGAMQEYSTLQAAADVVDPGDTVLVHDGNYKGFQLSRSGTQSSPVVFLANGSNVVINTSASSGDGITLQNVDYVTIEGFKIQGSTVNCIASHNATPTSPMVGLTIRNNTCTGAGNEGFYLSEVSGSLIEDNTLSGNGASGSSRSHGLYLANAGSDNTVIRGNIIFNNTNSESNGIHANGDLSVGGDGLITGVTIEQNIIYGNGQNGINLDGVQNSTFRNNVVYGNVRHALRAFKIDGAQGPKNLVIYNNTFLTPSTGGWAIKFSEDQGGHVVFNNILLTDSSSTGSIVINNANFFSSNNIVVNKFSNNGETSTVTLSQWQALGYDANSFTSTSSALFVNTSQNNYQLVGTAPAIDAGLSSFQGTAAPIVDLINAARPQGNGYDIGAYEFGSGTTPPDTTPPAPPTGLTVQ